MYHALELIDCFAAKLADLSPRKDLDGYVQELRAMKVRLQRGETAYDPYRPQSDWGVQVAAALDNG